MTSTPQPSSAAVTVDRLVAQARTDRDAFANLYGLYYPRVFRYCQRRLTDRKFDFTVWGASVPGAGGLPARSRLYCSW